MRVDAAEMSEFLQLRGARHAKWTKEGEPYSTSTTDHFFLQYDVANVCATLQRIDLRCLSFLMSDLKGRYAEEMQKRREEAQKGREAKTCAVESSEDLKTLRFELLQNTSMPTLMSVPLP